MTEREAFEAWWIPLSDGLDVEFEKNEAGDYLNTHTAIAWSGWKASRKQALEEEKPARLKAWETAWDACRKQTIAECEAAARKELSRCGTHLYPDDIEAIAAAIRSLNSTH